MMADLTDLKSVTALSCSTGVKTVVLFWRPINVTVSCEMVCTSPAMKKRKKIIIIIDLFIFNFLNTKVVILFLHRQLLV